MIIKDLREFTIEVEKINGIYIKAMNEMTVSSDFQAQFLNNVREAFDSRLSGMTGEPIALYRYIIDRAFYQLKKKYRNMISKWNKKVIKNRGNVIWNGKDGMKTNGN